MVHGRARARPYHPPSRGSDSSDRPAWRSTCQMWPESVAASGFHRRTRRARTRTPTWNARDTRQRRGAAVGGHMRGRDRHQLAPGGIHPVRVGRGWATLSSLLDDGRLNALSAWCQAHLHSGIESIIFEAGFASQVLGLRLREGGEVRQAAAVHAAPARRGGSSLADVEKRLSMSGVTRRSNAILSRLNLDQCRDTRAGWRGSAACSASSEPGQ